MVCTSYVNCEMLVSENQKYLPNKQQIPFERFCGLISIKPPTSCSQVPTFGQPSPCGADILNTDIPYQFEIA